MANKKITELTELTSAATDDVLAIVDVSGTAETKKITVANLTSGASGLLTQVVTTVNNAAVLTMKYDDTPITLVAADALTITVPVSVTIVTIGAGSVEGSNAELRLGWDAATSTSAEHVISMRRYMDGLNSGTFTTMFTPFQNAFTTSYTASAQNQPLQVWSSGVFDGGWSMTLYTTYYSITV